MSRLVTVLAFMGLSMAMSYAAGAQAQNVQGGSTLPDVYAEDLSVANAQALRLKISELSETHGLSEATLISIAERQQALYSESSFSSLLNMLEIRADQAKRLTLQFADLRERFNRMTNHADRTTALAALERAQTAFAAGRFELADKLFAQLTPLEGGQPRVGIENWQETVQARANLMILLGQYKEQVSFRREASRTFPNLTRKAQFELMTSAAMDAYNEGIRLGRNDLLRLAIETNEQHILPLAPRAVTKTDWAVTQHDLGRFLTVLGTRTQGEDGIRLLTRSVAAYQAALEVYTRADMPIHWAKTQDNMGISLLTHGERAKPEIAARLVNRAISAHEAALSVFTKSDSPKDWASAQFGLGNALLNQGNRTKGDAGTRLLGRAVAAFSAALEVYTFTNTPIKWADVNNNLGNALDDQGSRTQGEAGTLLQARAIEAYKASLQVYTRSNAPREWSRTQANLGSLFGMKWLKASKRSDEISYAKQAINHLKNAKSIYPDDHPKAKQYGELIDATQAWLNKNN